MKNGDVVYIPAKIIDDSFINDGAVQVQIGESYKPLIGTKCLLDASSPLTYEGEMIGVIKKEYAEKFAKEFTRFHFRQE